jgi:hypothetical protein
METVNDVRDALSARSRTATLEELASEGRKRVRLIKAEHVAAMISAAVHSAVEQSGLIPKEEVENLVERSREEFRTMMRDRQSEIRRLEELEDLVRAREEELAQVRAELAESRGAGGGPRAAAGSAGGGADVSAALEKLAGSLNERLEKLGKKMGISAAVEGEQVDFSGLFKDTGKELESNMENIKIKQKAGGGIAANLEKLKKLKGGS